ncbi:unnamed protein product [Closterium sp. Naga37s-1]|nr:unnamed protein product [Closterium sp. Naga37s-1]
MPLAARSLDLSSNFLSGPLPNGACRRLSFDANCFTLPLGCQDRNYSSTQPVLPPASVLTKGTQRETSGNFTAAPVTLFVYETGQALSGCGLELAFHANFTFSLSPRSGRVGFNGFAFVVSAMDRVGSGAGVGYGGMDKRSMAVEFDTLQNKEHGDMSSQHVGLNIRGEDKSLAAVRSPFPLSNRKAYTALVDYEPGDPGTIQVFLADSQEKPQEALLERRLALCEVLQGAAEQPAFFFGFVASTTVKPFQRHVILESTVDTDEGSAGEDEGSAGEDEGSAGEDEDSAGAHEGVDGSLWPAAITNTYMPAWASPFPRYVSADYRVAPSKQDSWVISACWAFAVVASVEAAYGIAMNAEAPRLSVESLFAAMGLTSEADKCITGGSPTEALERLLMLPRGRITEAGSSVSSVVMLSQDRNYSSSQPVLPPASVLTKGTQRETGGNFTAAPVTLFVYEAVQALSGCGLELAFHANFTFSLLPRSGRVGFNGFAFVVSATDRVGSGAGVGYGGMDTRSMAVEFDTLQNKEHGDMRSQHVGLNIRGEDRSLAAVRSPFPLSKRKAYTAWVDYEPGDPGTIQVFLADSQEKPQQAVLERRLVLCEVLQGAAKRPAFFFGFVASTIVKPVGEDEGSVGEDEGSAGEGEGTAGAHEAYGMQLSTNTYMPAWASPFPRYVSADYRVAPSKQDSWVISDFHSWDSVPFLG